LLTPAGRRDEWRREWAAEMEAVGRWHPIGALLDAALLRADAIRDGFWTDLRYGARTLARTPLFALSAIVALGTGIGANSALFSAVHAMLWRTPGQIADPERVAHIYTSDYSGPLFGMSSFPDYEHIRRNSKSLAETGAYSDGEAPVLIAAGSEPEQASICFATTSYFHVLGVRPYAGEFFATDSQEEAAVISDRFWERRFGRMPSALGASLQVNGVPMRVIGIAPAGFQGSGIEASPDLWVPLLQIHKVYPGFSRTVVDRRSRSLEVVARLRQGALLDQLRGELAVTAAALSKEHPADWTDRMNNPRRLTAVPLNESTFDPGSRGEAKEIAAMGFAVLGTVLLAVCATVGSMLLARARSRDREFAIRVSLGADRARLVRQLLTESGILAALGSALGIVLASWSMQVLNRTPSLWMGLDGVRLQLESDVLLYTAAITILAAAASGLTPAWLASRKDLNAVMAGVNARGDGRRLSRFLVAAQVCLSVTLLICSALLVRSFAKAQDARTGFRWEGVTLARLDLSGRGFTAQQSSDWTRGLVEHLQSAVPGVEAAAISERVMLVERLPRRGLRVEGYTYAPGESTENHTMFVSPGYLSLLGIPLLDGRALAWTDTPDRARVAVVNEAYARKYWPGKSALGNRMQSPRGPITIVGVAANTLFGSPTDPPGRPLLYLPVTQEVRPVLTAHLKLRPGTSPGTVREGLRSYESTLFPTHLASYEGSLREAAMPRWFATVLVGMSGFLALFLAALGLYGVLSFTVSQHRREIGVRLAVGGPPMRVARQVFAGMARLLAAGVVAGIAITGGAAQLLGSWLYGITPWDPLSWAGVLVLLGGAGVLASWAPLRRLVQVDPVTALRQD